MTEILDSNGTLITEGARVVDHNGNEEGTVIDITEPDGDVNEYGRPVPIGPYVFVKYDGNDEVERWTATWNATGPWDDDRDDYTCDDVTVADSRTMTHTPDEARYQPFDALLACSLDDGHPCATCKREADSRAIPRRGEGVDLAAVERLEKFAAQRSRLWDSFMEQGGRGVELADEIDRLDAKIDAAQREPDGQRMEAGRIVPTDR